MKVRCKYMGLFGDAAWLHSPVTYLPNHKAIRGQCVEIGAFLEATQFDPDLLAKVQAIRDCKDTSQKRQLKQDLPTIIPAAHYKTSHKAKDPHTLSGLLCVDIDRHDNTSLPDDEWRNIPHDLQHSQLAKFIAFIGESASGWQRGGWFVLFAVPCDDEWRGHFCSIHRWFKLQGIAIDPSAQNINHCRALSHQSILPFVNPNPTPYPFTLSVVRPATIPAATIPTNPDREWQRAQRVVQAIKEAGVDICPNYQDWQSIAFALANGFGDAGRVLFETISKCNPKAFNEIECSHKYTDALKTGSGGTTLATFWAVCKRNGFDPKNYQ